MEIKGRFFDSLHPPRIDIHGNPIGGRELDRDTAYSMKFWAKRQPEGTKEAMQENIRRVAQTGEFSMFYGLMEAEDGKRQFDEKTKEKMSAYRKLAEEMGYMIGPFDNINESAGTVGAKIMNPTSRPQS